MDLKCKTLGINRNKKRGISYSQFMEKLHFLVYHKTTFVLVLLTTIYHFRTNPFIQNLVRAEIFFVERLCEHPTIVLLTRWTAKEPTSSWSSQSGTYKQFRPALKVKILVTDKGTDERYS